MNAREKARKAARRLAADSIARQDPTGWFEQLYAQAEGHEENIPWGDMEPNPQLVDWFEDHPKDRGEALVVGCGLGDDAAFLVPHCKHVVAFDISPSAVEWCKRRYPAAPVAWLVADLFALPSGLKGRFDFVYEANTLQTLPPDVRPAGVQGMIEALAPGGELLVLCRGRDAGDDPGEMPWPLTRSELDLFKLSLKEESFLDFHDEQSPPVRRFRALYRK